MRISKKDAYGLDFSRQQHYLKNSAQRSSASIDGRVQEWLALRIL